MNTPANYDTFVSVIIPVRNAAEQIEKALLDVSSAMQSMFRNYEIVLIDDASQDKTVSMIGFLQRRIENVQLFCLNRTVGFEIATIAGLDNCIGDFVFILNLETDPVSILSKMWSKAQDGNEVVCGVRTDALRGSLRKGLSRCYYALYRVITGISIPVGLSSPRLYDRKVVSYIIQNNDRNLMLKVLPFFCSYHIATVDYTAMASKDSFGEQSIASAILSGISILLGSSSSPLRLFTVMALMSSFVSLLYSLYVILVAIFKRHVVEGWISLAFPLAVISFFLSSLLGIVAEYVYVLVQQSGHRPAYLIVSESTSSVLDVRKKLNVVEGNGNFFADPGGAAAVPAFISSSKSPDIKTSALIGHSGFVGTTLLRQRGFDRLFRSTNIGDVHGQVFDEVVCAAAPAQKWKANNDPEADLQCINELMRHIEEIICNRFILISTVDVFKQPCLVDETTPIEDHPEAYGRNRRLLEKFVEDRFPNSFIIRLPGLVGPGLKKNVIFDLLNQNNVQAIDSRARFQFYPMVNLWPDIQTTIEHGIRLVHLTAEPIGVREITQQGFGFSFENHVADNPADYCMRTRYAEAFGKSGFYQYSKHDSFLAIRAYVQSEARTLKVAE
jgi:glycosyltransferase involved in cell wall biosynthesis